VCAAEGRRGSRRRRFARWEIEQLAAIFGIPARQLLTRCATCDGQSPPGFARLTCKAEHPAAPGTHDQPVSTRVDEAIITVTVTVYATLSAGDCPMTHRRRWRQTAGGPGLAQGRDKQRHLPRH
jgi:hypothetical protein